TGGLDPQQLLRRQLQRFLPAGLTERRVPVFRRRNPIADVQVEPLEQRQLAYPLSGGAGRGAWLGAPALALNGAPWASATFGVLRPRPSPAAVFFGPSLPD